MEEYLGAIKMFAGDYAPPNWMLCQGQLLNVTDYKPLFAVLGNAFGGDGQTTFALPDFRGRGPIGANPAGASGFPAIVNGAMGGAESLQLTAGTMPRHTHPVAGSIQPEVSALPADTDTPINNYIAQSAVSMFQTEAGTEYGGNVYYNFFAGETGSTSPAPVPVLSPYQVVNYIIFVTQNSNAGDGGNGG